MNQPPRPFRDPADLPFRWVGGHLVLDFLNTVTLQDDGTLINERLHSDGRAAQWFLVAGLATREVRHPPDGVADQARRLRRSIRALISARATRRPVDRSAAALFHRVLREALAHRRLTPDGTAWQWEGPRGGVGTRWLWSIAIATADLLVSADMAKVRLCAGRDCGFTFLDRGRGRGRRWCDMADCGNLAKVRRFRARQRSRE